MAKRIEFEGRVHEFPDDFTDAEIASALEGVKPAQPAPGADLPDVNDLYRQNWPTVAAIEDKFGRMVTNAIPLTGVADLIGTVGNIAADKLGIEGSRYKPVTPMIREAMGIRELPADAPALDRITETAGSILLGGGGRSAAPVSPGVTGAGAEVVKRGVNSTVDAVAGDALSQFGYAYGGDLGALTGALAGGVARPAATAAAGEVASKLGNSKAGEIYDAARRIEVEPTAGMVGNDFIGGTEKTLSAFPITGAPVNYARDVARSGLESATDRAATAIRGGPAPADPVLPGHVGQAVADAAAAERSLSFDYAKGYAENLNRTMGTRPVPLAPVDQAYGTAQAAGQGMAELTDLGQWYERLQGQRPPAPVIQPGQPAVPGRPAVPPVMRMGPNGMPVPMIGTGSPAVPGIPAVPPVLGPQPNAAPWNVMQNMKQEVGVGTSTGRPFDQRLSDILYGGIKDAERSAANAVAPGMFDLTNEVYAGNIGKNGVVDRLNPLAGGFDPRNDKPIGDRTLPNYEMLKRGMRAPGAMDVFTNDVPVAAQGPAFGNYVDTLGRPATPGPDFEFSPTKFSKEWNAVMPESKDIATRTAPGTRSVLDDVATAGQKYDLPPQAYGLTKTLGNLGTAMAALGGVGAATSGIAATALTGGIPLMIGAALESRPVVRGLAGRYAGIMERLQQNLPATLVPNAQAAIQQDRPQ